MGSAFPQLPCQLQIMLPQKQRHRSISKSTARFERFPVTAFHCSRGFRYLEDIHSLGWSRGSLASSLDHFCPACLIVFRPHQHTPLSSHLLRVQGMEGTGLGESRKRGNCSEVSLFIQVKLWFCVVPEQSRQPIHRCSFCYSAPLSLGKASYLGKAQLPTWGCSYVS